MSWPTKKLGELVEKGTGIAYKSSDFISTHKPSAVPVILLKDFEHPNFTEKFLINFDKYKNHIWVKKGDILISKTSEIKLCIWNGGDAVLNQNAMRFRAKKEVLQKFLYFVLSNIVENLRTKLVSTTIPYVKEGWILNTEIPLPPLEIQKRIVARIEELFEKIDKVKQLREKALEETEQIFQSALQEVFEKAEKKWGRKTLGEIIELHYGKGIPQKDRKTDGKYPIYGANGELGRTDKYLVEGEAIIIGRKGTAGAVNRVSGRFWPADVTYYVFGNEKIDIDFLFYAFKKIDLSQLATGIKPGISRNKVYELQIPLPPLSEQKKIVAYLDDLREKIEKLKQLQQKQLEELTELKNSILEKAFKGELIK
jgi:type I restriction enzyme S subunit